MVRAASSARVSPGTPPPALSPRALQDELKRASRDRRSEREQLDAERERLERLAKEIAEARAALKDETRKLEALVAAGTGDRANGGKPGKPGARLGPGLRSGAGRADEEPTPVDTLARTVKGMRPAEAAALLTRLDRPLAAAILAKLKPADAAPVVEKLEPGLGAALFALLARSGEATP
jgi:flagellar motility protein MotE (MotC chaperone)